MSQSGRLLLALVLVLGGAALSEPGAAADPTIILEHFTNFR